MGTKLWGFAAVLLLLPFHHIDAAIEDFLCGEYIKQKARKAANYRHHLANPAFLDYVRLNLIVRRHRFAGKKALVPLRLLSQMHPMDYPISSARRRLFQRVDILRDHSHQIEKAGKLSWEIQQALIPSDNPIYAIPYGPTERYATFNGNSRLEALRMVFGNDSNLLIEVNVASLPTKKVGPRVERIRQLQGLTD